MNAASEIQRTIHQNRKHIALEYTALGEELNVANRLRLAVQRKPWTWLSGAALAGMTLSFLKPTSLANIATAKKSKRRGSSTPTLEDGKTSTFSKAALVTTSLLENKALRSGLITTARFLFPLLQQGLTSHAARKRNQTTKNR